MTNDRQHPGPSDPTPGPTEQVPAPTEQFSGADPSAQNLGYAQYEGSPSLYDQQPSYGAPGEQYGYVGTQPYTPSRMRPRRTPGSRTPPSRTVRRIRPRDIRPHR